MVAQDASGTRAPDHVETLLSAKTDAAGQSRKRESSASRRKVKFPVPGRTLSKRRSGLIKEGKDTHDEGGAVQQQDLTHNQRHMLGTPDLAGSIVNVLEKLFPTTIDKLPRRVSFVYAKSLPVCICNTTLDAALGILFKQGGNGNVGNSGEQIRELGAKQAVLVWNEKKQEEVKKHFPMSIVLTIDDCKNLEFSDVLIFNPFSDMASSAAHQTKPADLWSLVYHCMPEGSCIEQEVPPVDESAHSLLCSWLRALYVAVNCAQRRVWIFDEKQGPMLDLWQAAGMVHLVSSATDAQDLAEGFAQASKPEELIEGGQIMLRNEYYHEASMLFERAENADHPGARFWRLFATASQLRQKASLGEGTAAYKRHYDAGTSFKELAQELERLPPACRPKKLDARTVLLAAAASFLDGFAFKESAQIYDKEEEWSKSAICWESAESWTNAGIAWLKSGNVERSLSAFARGQAWAQFTDVAERAAGDSKASVESGVVQELVCSASQQLALRLATSKDQDAVLRSEHAVEQGYLIRCLKLVPEGRSRDVFVGSLALPSMELELLEMSGRFGECAVFCLEQLDWGRAQHFRQRQGRPDLVEHLKMLRCLHQLGWGGPPAMTGAADLEPEGFQPHSEEERIVQQGLACLQARDLAGPGTLGVQQVLRELWDMGASEDAAPGHALRFRLLAFAAGAQHAGTAPRAFLLDSLLPLYTIVKEATSHLAAALAECLSVQDGERQPPVQVERTILQLLLAEQPPSVHPSYLILSDMLPAAPSGQQLPRRLPYDKLLKLAHAVVSLLQLRLHYQFLAACWPHLPHAKPCWSRAVHGEHLIPGCPAQEGADMPGREHAVMALLAWRARHDAHQLSKSAAVPKAFDTLGSKGEELMGTLGKHLRTEEWLQKSRPRLLELLLAGFPFKSLRCVGGPTLGEAVAKLVQEGMNHLVAAVREKRKPPTLAELLAPSSTLLFSPLARFHGLPELRNAVAESWRRAMRQQWWHHRSGSNMSIRADGERPDTPSHKQEVEVCPKNCEDARRLLYSLALAESATPCGSREGGRELQYGGPFNFHNYNRMVVKHLWDDWWAAGDSKVFPVPPHAFCHLLECVVVWSTVLLTRLSNTTLPESYVRTHLAPHARLAALAAENGVDGEERRSVIQSRTTVISCVCDLLSGSERFAAWVEGHCEHYGTTLLRLLTVLFACGSINWHKVSRNKIIRNSLLRISFQTRLKIMNKGTKFSTSSLPKQLQWLVAGPPEDQKHDYMTPWFHSVLAGFGDPFVICCREDSSEAPPNWTKALHPLRFHREEFLSSLNTERNLSMILECFGSQGQTWPPAQIKLQWPALRQIMVYRPGQSVANFSLLDQASPASPGAHGPMIQEGSAEGFKPNDDTGSVDGNNMEEDLAPRTSESAAAKSAITANIAEEGARVV